MKKLCKTELVILEEMKARRDDPLVPNSALFALHKNMYHRSVKEYDKQMEHCLVWNEVVEEVTWEEMMQYATTS